MADSILELMESAEREGWGDGLPLVPVDDERLDVMLASTARPEGETVGPVPPAMAVATVGKIAVNAVLAGCRPTALPVVLAAVEAILDDDFNLPAIQSTTGPAGVLLVVNGPVRARLGFASGSGALGPGHRANATLGRAVRLVLLTLGGAHPGAIDRATLGQPSKFTYCVAENEEGNPWSPLHVDRGYATDRSTVSAFPAEGPINLNDVSASTPFSVLRIAATNMSIIGPALYFACQPLVILSPEHAAVLAAHGWDKEDVKRFLYENARVPLHALPREDVVERLVKRWPRKYAITGEAPWITVADRWEDIVVMVAGGSGRHSTYIPPGGAARSVTVAIEEES